MLQRTGAIVRGFLLAPEHHGHPARWIELDHHVGPFIGDPDVVFFVDFYGVGEGPGIQIVTISRRYLPSGPNSRSWAALAS